MRFHSLFLKISKISVDATSILQEAEEMVNGINRVK